MADTAACLTTIATAVLAIFAIVAAIPAYRGLGQRPMI
jgi:hypothetical protein